MNSAPRGLPIQSDVLINSAIHSSHIPNSPFVKTLKKFGRASPQKSHCECLSSTIVVAFERIALEIISIRQLWQIAAFELVESKPNSSILSSLILLQKPQAFVLNLFEENSIYYPIMVEPIPLK